MIEISSSSLWKKQKRQRCLGRGSTSVQSHLFRCIFIPRFSSYSSQDSHHIHPKILIIFIPRFSSYSSPYSHHIHPNIFIVFVLVFSSYLPPDFHNFHPYGFIIFSSYSSPYSSLIPNCHKRAIK